MTDERHPGQYRKKPIVITGVRWTGDNFDVVKAFATDYLPDPPSADGRHLNLWIEKSNTFGRVRLGDWVLAERDGVGFYPCTAEEFDATYEPIDGPPTS